VVSSMPRPQFTSGKDPVPILQEVGWVPGQVWTGGKSRSHRDSIPDRPDRSQSLYRLSYPAHISSWLLAALWTLRRVNGGGGGERQENFRCIDVWGLNPECFGRVGWYRLRSRVEVSLWVNASVNGMEGLRFVSRIFNYTVIFALQPRRIMENVSCNGFKC